MRKSLDTRLIDNLNKRRPIRYPDRIDNIITENDVYRIKRTVQHGKYSYDIYLNKLYTGVNNIGYYLEENFDLNEIEDITILVNTLPNFYFRIIAFNEVGDDLFADYDIACTFNYISEREMPAQPLLEPGLSLTNGDSWFLSERDTDFTFTNFNGVWLIGSTIWEAE